MLDKQELAQIKDYIIQVLPEVIKQEPEVAIVIEGILAHQFPRRDEFARMLDELTAHRQETGQQFEQTDQNITQLRGDMNQRFGQVDQRFEQVDQRFGQVGQRLGKLEKTQLGMRRDIAGLKQGQETILKRLDSQEAWLRFVLGDLRNEKGHTLEDMFAVALRYGLKNPNITPESIRLRQKLVDVDGLVFKAGFTTEVDLIAENNNIIVYEVKTTGKVSEVGLFALKVELVTAHNPDKQVHGVFITLGGSEEIAQSCKQYGLELVY